MKTDRNKIFYNTRLIALFLLTKKEKKKSPNLNLAAPFTLNLAPPFTAAPGDKCPPQPPLGTPLPTTVV